MDFQSKLIILRGYVRKYFMVRFPRKECNACRGFGKVSSPLTNSRKEPFSAVAGVMEKQVVDAFNKPIHHCRGIWTSGFRSCLQSKLLVSLLKVGGLEMIHNIFHQTPDTSKKHLFPGVFLSCSAKYLTK